MPSDHCRVCFVAGANGQINAVFDQVYIRVRQPQIEFEVRILLEKRGDQRCHQLRAQRCAGLNSQRTAGPNRQLAHRVAQLVNVLNQTFGPLQIHLSSFRKRQLSCGSIEQSNAQVFFQSGYLARYAGRREACMAAGSRQTANLSHGQK